MVRAAILFLVVSVFISCGQNTQKNSGMDVSTVKALDLDRYLGTWYEIARFDHSFERNLEGVTATYSMRGDGKIKVVNQGYKGSLDGELKRAVGKAKLTSDPGKLKVSFFWFFYSDYLVLELDTDYRWVLIGSSSPNYLWILSRTPQLDEATKQHILDKAASRGYDTSKLIWVKQKPESSQ
ncbi:lipocalin family protein [Maribellus sediminis]|uniref:lipocalin family protein n=1 Tax=Maribellus sediminis TaxID=2696285 RepID=UPI00143028C9|nr:lipocalin family protein [Maribellus sediminis]